MTIRRRSASRIVGLIAGLAVSGIACAGELGGDPYADLPGTLSLTGTVRDFKGRNETGGHKDFEWQPKNAAGSWSYGQYVNIVSDDLDADGKPVFRSRGQKLTAQFRDSAGNNIMPGREYISGMAGDVIGRMEGVGYAVDNASDFAKWFRDEPGTNLSQSLPITLVREENTINYV